MIIKARIYGKPKATIDEQDVATFYNNLSILKQKWNPFNRILKRKQPDMFYTKLNIVLGLLQTFRFEILRRVSQNGKFVINPVQYPRGGTMVAKILDFMLFESMEKALSRSFSSPKLFLES